MIGPLSTGSKVLLGVLLIALLGLIMYGLTGCNPYMRLNKDLIMSVKNEQLRAYIICQGYLKSQAKNVPDVRGCDFMGAIASKDYEIKSKIALYEYCKKERQEIETLKKPNERKFHYLSLPTFCKTR